MVPPTVAIGLPLLLLLVPLLLLCAIPFFLGPNFSSVNPPFLLHTHFGRVLCKNAYHKTDQRSLPSITRLVLSGARKRSEHFMQGLASTTIDNLLFQGT